MSRVEQREAVMPNLPFSEIVRRSGFISFVAQKNTDSGTSCLYYLEKRDPARGFWCVRATSMADDIEPLATITTKHHKVSSIFDPTQEEYLAQIPLELLRQVVAIEFSNREATLADSHWVSRTNLFKKKEGASNSYSC